MSQLLFTTLHGTHTPSRFYFLLRDGTVVACCRALLYAFGLDLSVTTLHAPLNVSDIDATVQGRLLAQFISLAVQAGPHV